MLGGDISNGPQKAPTDYREERCFYNPMYAERLTEATLLGVTTRPLLIGVDSMSLYKTVVRQEVEMTAVRALSKVEAGCVLRQLIGEVIPSGHRAFFRLKHHASPLSP